MDATTPKDLVLAAALARRQRLIGIALMTGASVLFSAIDACAKFLVQGMHPIQAVGIRYIGGFLVALVIVNPIAHPARLRARRPGLQIVRSAIAVACAMLYFTAFGYLQLDQTTAILFATPFFVALLSGPLLGERLGPRRWAAILVGFAGVLVVTRPGLGGIHPAAILCVVGSVSYALYNITTRMLAGSDSDETTLFYSNLVGVVLLAPVMPLLWTPPRTLVEVAVMVAVSVLGAVGHFMLIIAHRYAPAGVLAPFIYAQLLGAVVFGFLVFDNLPSLWTVAGAAIVVASGLYLIYRERRVKGDGG